MTASAAITIVDLGLGNLHSVARAVERAGGTSEITSDADRVRRSERVLVPGQGAFGAVSRALKGELGPALKETIAAGVPYLGICLGMQALLERSEEAPGEGLGVFAGSVLRFRDRVHEGEALKVPHMGWNQVRGSSLTRDGEWYYFVHSFYCAPDDESLIVGRADYGGEFCAAIARDNVFACQFHPEKSHRAGERLVRRFLKEEPPWS